MALFRIYSFLAAFHILVLCQALRNYPDNEGKPVIAVIFVRFGCSWISLDFVNHMNQGKCMYNCFSPGAIALKWNVLKQEFCALQLE